MTSAGHYLNMHGMERAGMMEKTRVNIQPSFIKKMNLLFSPKVISGYRKHQIHHRSDGMLHAATESVLMFICNIRKAGRNFIFSMLTLITREFRHAEKAAGWFWKELKKLPTN